MKYSRILKNQIGFGKETRIFRKTRKEKEDKETTSDPYNPFLDLRENSNIKEGFIGYKRIVSAQGAKKAH